MLKLTMLAALCAMLTACATHYVTSSTPRQVVVSAGLAFSNEALQDAEKECQKHGRHAVLSGKLSVNEFVYECVN